MANDVNTEITDRIASIEDEDMQSFLNKIVSYERELLPQTRPHYKDDYRKYAKPHLNDESNGGDAE